MITDSNRLFRIFLKNKGSRGSGDNHGFTLLTKLIANNTLKPPFQFSKIFCTIGKDKIIDFYKDFRHDIMVVY
ncbi:MAG: hypothetical protein ACOC2U_02450 [bacterium]